MALKEYTLFSSIKPWECLNQSWTKKDKAPNIIAMIDRFNLVTPPIISHTPDLMRCIQNAGEQLGGI